MDFIKGIFNSVVGALIGLALAIGSIPLLFWNENRAVETHRSLVEGQKVLIRADAGRLDRGQEGKLVYVSGDAKPNGQAVDDRTNFRPPVLVLERKTEMFQWDESEHTSGSGSHKTRSYTYSKGWLSHLERSGNFHDPEGHKNPNDWKLPPATFTPASASLGAWQVPAAVLKTIDPNQTWVPEAKDLKSLPAQLAATAHLSGEHLYFSQKPDAPEIGDERVKYRIVPTGPISVIAQQTGNAVGEYHTSNGRALLLAEAGAVTPEVMFQHAFTKANILTWILRGVGALLMFIGIRLLIEPLTALTDWIPFLGEVIDSGATLAAGAIALGGSAITIAVAWFAVRPLLSGGLTLGAVGVFMLARKKKS